MKKFLSLLMVLVIVIIIVQGYKWVTGSTNDKLNEKLVEAQEIVNKNNDEENEEKIKRLEIQALQNPEIINEAMIKVGELVVFKSGVTYKDVVRNTNFWGAKEAYVDLKFKYGISYDFTKVAVDKFVEKTVYIKVNKFDLGIEFIEEDTDTSNIKSESTWLAHQFKPADTEAIRDNAKVKVREFVQNYQEAYIQGMESLKENLKGFVLKLGYDNVVFVET